MQLLFGYRSAAEAVRTGGATLRGAPVELIEALFPRDRAAGCGLRLHLAPGPFPGLCQS